MAYLNYVASVDWSEVEHLRAGARKTLQASRVASVSHLLAYGVKDQPLGTVLKEILDQGDALASSFWHPVRVPVVHTPDAARILGSELRASLQTVNAGRKNLYVNDYEITEIVKVLDDAVQNRLGIVSVLEPPADQERARRVACPFAEPEKLPNFPWGNLTQGAKHLAD